MSGPYCEPVLCPRDGEPCPHDGEDCETICMREERKSQCDCCAEYKLGCVNIVYSGMDTHVCPKCRGDKP